MWLAHRFLFDWLNIFEHSQVAMFQTCWVPKFHSWWVDQSSFSNTFRMKTNIFPLCLLLCHISRPWTTHLHMCPGALWRPWTPSLIPVRKSVKVDFWQIRWLGWATNVAWACDEVLTMICHEHVINKLWLIPIKTWFPVGKHHQKLWLFMINHHSYIVSTTVVFYDIPFNHSILWALNHIFNHH